MLESLTNLITSPTSGQLRCALLMTPLLPLIGFLINGFVGRKLSPRLSGGVASLAIGLAFGCALLATYHTFFGPNASAMTGLHATAFDWIEAGSLKVSFGLALDQLSAVMALVITGVGTLIHVYSIGYMAHDKAWWRYFAYLNLFCFAMLCLVLGDNMLLLFLGWEGVGLCSYLLIGFWYEDIEKSKAGKKAFIVNRIGDLGFLIGMFLLFWHFKTLTFSEMLAPSNYGLLSAEHSSLFTWAGIFLFIGACGKSAQLPLYIWLPDAMAGPTPVSALIHAATMVTAGVYMVSRLSPIYALAPLAMDVVAVVGGLTALFAGSIALVQRDIKKVLAYSTVSQLGFMFMAAGVGAYQFAIFHLVTHAFFKALLFLGSGSVIHALEHSYGHGNPDAQDLRLMGGLYRKMPTTGFTMMVGGLALAGVPPLAGFFSKDEILLSALERFPFVYALGVAAAAMTAFYTARMLALAFFGKFRGKPEVWAHCHESPAVMTIPLVILAAFAFSAGFLNIPHNVAHGKDHFAQFVGPVFWDDRATGLYPAMAEEVEQKLAADQARHHSSAAALHSAAREGFADAARIMLERDARREAVNEAYIEAAQHAEAHGSGAAWGNMIFSSLLAVFMFFLAFRFYERPDALARADKRAATARFKPVFATLLNKYYVDELYEKLIVRPIRLTAQVLHIFFDMLFIDTLLVSGSAFVVGALSHVLRRIQTGIVTHYLYVFALGAAAVLLYFVMA